MLARRISDPDVWVRAKAAKALTRFGSAASSELTPMLKAVTVNATNPSAVDWRDPIQISNGFLTEALFNNSIAAATIAAPKELLYPAVKVGIKQPDSHARCYMNDFIEHKLTREDVQALLPDICRLVAVPSEADTMWHPYPRAVGIGVLAKYQIKEGIALALKMQVVPEGFGWGGDKFIIPGLYALGSYGDAARWTLPALKKELSTSDPKGSIYKALVETIAIIEKSTPAMNRPKGLAR